MGRKKTNTIPEAELARAVYGSSGDGEWARELSRKYGISIPTVYRQANELKSRAMGHAKPGRVVCLQEVRSKKPKKADDAVDRNATTVSQSVAPSDTDDADLAQLKKAVADASSLTVDAARRSAEVVLGPSGMDGYFDEAGLLDVIENLKTSSRISRSALVHLDARVEAAKRKGKVVKDGELALYAKMAKEFRDLSRTVYEIEEAVVRLSKEAFEDVFMKEVLNAIYEAEPETGRRIFEAIRSRSKLLGAFIEGGSGALLAAGRPGVIEAVPGKGPAGQPPALCGKPPEEPPEGRQ